MNRYQLTIAALLVLVTVTMRWAFQEKERADDAEGITTALQSNLVKVVNKKDSTETAYKALIQGELKQMKKALDQADANQARLLEMMKDKAFAGSAVNTTTIINEATATDTIYIGVDSMPVYHGEISQGGWITGSITAGADSIRPNLRVTNRLDIWHKYESQGLFKPKKAMVYVHNLNPYTTTDELYSYSVKEPKRRTGLKVAIGVGIGIIGGLMLAK